MVPISFYLIPQMHSDLPSIVRVLSRWRPSLTPLGRAEMIRNLARVQLCTRCLQDLVFEKLLSGHYLGTKV